MEGTGHSTEKIFSVVEQHLAAGETAEAARLFNGFYEGYPGLVIDRYGSALVLLDHDALYQQTELIRSIAEWSLAHLPGVKSVLLKSRYHEDQRLRKGILVGGNALPQEITEFGVRYALDLQMNQDAGFYLDTRLLRRWLIEHGAGLRVLNTFAYTGSLGVAAGKGGASQVVQTDLSRTFLEMARRSWSLNGLPADRHQLIVGDFFRFAGRMRSQSRLFDCVILDPPYFSTTDAGKVDLQHGTTRLVNKIRPVVAHEGWLIVINNALFLTGADFMSELERLCQGQYLVLDSILPVSLDVTGYPETIVDQPPADPAPFNHPTKIAILKVFRKDQQK